MPPDYVYDTYVFFWTAAVKGEDAYGIPCNADLDGDGQVRMHEAFIYAEANDFSYETPQYDSDPADLGDRMTLLGASKTLLVPLEFPSIQAAIDASSNNDTILVDAGTFSEEAIVIDGKSITVEAMFGPAKTAIDGSASAYTVSFSGADADGSVLNGFSVSGADSSGVLCNDCDPVLLRNRIVQNGKAGTLVNGGGVYCTLGGSPSLVSCLVADNQGINGGGIGTATGCLPELINCTVIDNIAAIGGGIHDAAGAKTTATNSIIWDNTPDQIGGTFPATLVTYSDVQGGYSGDGNIDRDPLFADGEGRLEALSPCINMGDNTPVMEPLDLYGVDRLQAGCVDMGACECESAVLQADEYTLNPRRPGQVNLSIEFGTAYAGRSYAVVGGLSGRLPGIAVQGIVIPVNWDAYTDMVLLNLNTYIFTDFMGSLDANGAAMATLNYPGGGEVAWVGYVMHHAAFNMGPFDAASNPIPVMFTNE